MCAPVAVQRAVRNLRFAQTCVSHILSSDCLTWPAFLGMLGPQRPFFSTWFLENLMLPENILRGAARAGSRRRRESMMFPSRPRQRSSSVPLAVNSSRVERHMHSLGGDKDLTVPLRIVHEWTLELSVSDNLVPWVKRTQRVEDRLVNSGGRHSFEGGSVRKS